MLEKLKLPAALVLSLLILGCTGSLERQNVARMSVADLHERLGQADLVIIDARTPGEWQRAQVKIPGAVREDPARIDWAGNYAKGNTLVLYCT